MISNRRTFLKQVGISAAGLAYVSAAPGYFGDFGGSALPRSSPEQQACTSSRLKVFLDEVAKSNIEFHSLMVVRNGYVVAEGWWSPYRPTLRHTLYSLSKSFTSTAVGFAVGEGKLNIDDTVISFFPSEAPEQPDANLLGMKVKHLLTMSTGHVKDTIQPMRHGKDTWVRTFLTQPVDREPGTFFLYNTGATYILSAIVQKVTGETLLQYLRPRFFDPLGIEGEDWETDPLGINTGGYGLRVKTEDIAKFGQFYLQKGKWRGQQILSSQWIEEATRTQIVSNSSNPSRPREEDDWAQGYGFQFWRCRPGGYRADGAFGQFCIVMPDYNAVIAITGESFSMQKSMDLIWTYLLPSMDKTHSTLPADPKHQEDLKQMLDRLSLQPPVNQPISPVAAIISGKDITLAPNEFMADKIRLDFKNDNCLVTVTGGKGVQRVSCGINKWIEQRNEKNGTPFPVVGRMDVTTSIAGSVCWLDDNRLLMTWRLTESCHTNGLTFVFTNNNVVIKFHSSISQGNPKFIEKRADLKGSFVA